MTYLETDLGDDEQIKYQGKIHSFYPFIMILWSFIGFLLIISFFTNGYGGILFFGGGIMLFFIYKIIYIFTTEIFVTNKRVFYKEGVIARNIFELQLKQIESVTLNQTFFQRIIGAGTLTIKGTGGDGKPIVQLAKPHEMKKVIYNEMGNIN